MLIKVARFLKRIVSQFLVETEGKKHSSGQLLYTVQPVETFANFMKHNEQVDFTIFHLTDDCQLIYSKRRMIRLLMMNLARVRTLQSLK